MFSPSRLIFGACLIRRDSVIFKTAVSEKEKSFSWLGFCLFKTNKSGGGSREGETLSEGLLCTVFSIQIIITLRRTALMSCSKLLKENFKA